MMDLGQPEFFLNPSLICSIPRKTFKKWCMTHLEEIRHASEVLKPTVQTNQLILSTTLMQPYLTYHITRYDRFVLTHLRQYVFYRSVSFPMTNDWTKNLANCPCDGSPPQSTIHVVLFCKYYPGQRKRWILPILRILGLRQCRPAYLALQILDNECFTRNIALFLKSVIKHRKKL